MTSTFEDRVDGISSSVAVKAPVRCATTANITLSGTQTVDGVALAAGDRVLVKDQTDDAENGIYVVAATAWARASDFDGNRDVRTGTLVYAASGTANGGSFWRVTTANDITIGTSSITWAASTNQIANITAFVETLVDDPDAAAFLTTLGFSAFIQTLIGDADAATARATLGAQADLDVPSQAEAEAGTATTERVWTAERVAQAIAALAAGGGQPNLTVNGAFQLAPEAATMTAATTPANNDDTYFNFVNLLSDGNDIVDLSHDTATKPTGAYAALKGLVATANKQFGFLFPIEARNTPAGGTVSFSFDARKGGSNATLGTLRAALVAWSSTADSITTDVIGTWAGGGTDPTLAANWTYENTPSDLTLTTSFQTFSVEGIAVDTASAANIGLLIWVDDTDATVNDEVYIGNVQVVEGDTAPAFRARPVADEEQISARYFQEYDMGLVGWATSTTAIAVEGRFSARMRAAPSATLVDTSPSFQMADAAVQKTGSSSSITATAVSVSGARVTIDGFTGLTAGDEAFSDQTATIMTFDARL